MEKSAKEKAEELVDKFYNVQASQPCSWSEAKQCALICSDTVINELIKQNPNYEKNTYWSVIDYWQEVKRKIELIK